MRTTASGVDDEQHDCFASPFYLHQRTSDFWVCVSAFAWLLSFFITLRIRCWKSIWGCKKFLEERSQCSNPFSPFYWKLKTEYHSFLLPLFLFPAVSTSMQLKSAYAGNNFDSGYNLTEAHMFLSHFIGDVHQVRDNMIIESAMKTFYNSDLSIMIQSIQKNITADEVEAVLTNTKKFSISFFKNHVYFACIDLFSVIWTAIQVDSTHYCNF
ncbi:endonuclease 4-like isoform X2 [Senna tora]|uniref:Aspergillus nuclease S1 n=1 Tax=Senna tora TaxID=362788 RepID=A0A834T4M1_9FABA|nr:endonuclease 4-like isoform X2 [Senna tora]